MDELIRNLFASSGRAFERIGLPQYAASCAKKSGNDAEAQRILYEASIRHEASGKFVKAARCARKSGDDRRAWMMYDRAIEEKEQKGMFLDVARLFEEKGDYASAIACYIDSKVNATLEAARVAFSKLKDPDLASCICEKNGMNMQAAYYATNIGNYEKARKLQEREQDGVNASVLSDLTESGKLKEADEFATQHSITSYLDERQKQIDSQHAFNIYTRHGMVDCIAQEGSEAELKEVLKEYDKKKRYVEGAELAKKIGQYDEAFLFYEKAAALALRKNDPANALKFYKEAGDLAVARNQPLRAKAYIDVMNHVDEQTRQA